jgi:hypothetical protein
VVAGEMHEQEEDKEIRQAEKLFNPNTNKV